VGLLFHLLLIPTVMQQKPLKVGQEVVALTLMMQLALKQIKVSGYFMLLR
jgi:hypothetical protein